MTGDNSVKRYFVMMIGMVAALVCGGLIIGMATFSKSSSERQLQIKIDSLQTVIKNR